MSVSGGGARGGEGGLGLLIVGDEVDVQASGGGDGGEETGEGSRVLLRVVDAREKDVLNGHLKGSGTGVSGGEGAAC